MPTLDDLIGYSPPVDVKGVTQDLYSKVYLPANTTEFSTLLSGSGLNPPSSIWVAANASGSSLADSGSAGRTVTIAGSPTLGAAAPGFAATGIKATDGSALQFASCTIPSITTNSSMMLQIFGVNTNPAAFRALGNIGDSGYEAAQIVAGTTGPKLRGRSGGNTTDGEVNHSSIMVVVTRLDITNSTFGAYSRGEQIKPTYSGPAGSTALYILGDEVQCTDATLVYAAFWTGADAEISDANIQKLIDFVYGDSTTLSKLQAGSTSVKMVAAIEGCEYLLCESNTTAALRAWAGSDWTSALPGLFVELKNSQSVTPWDPFTGAGSCKLSVLDTDGTDVFGELVNKRLSGAESELTETLDRNDTTIKIAASQDFSSSGTAYIGTEAIGYTGKTSTTLTGATRGKWSPFGCASSGSGGSRFANHHRVGPDPFRVETKPIVSQLPRVWLGKRVGVWMHTWDEATQTMNSRDEAQLVYAGRIAAIADDPNSFCTTIDVEPVHEEIRNGVIGQDLWSATVADGLTLVEGRVFGFYDIKFGVGTLTANSLTVVAAGTASGTNQMDAGRYTADELCQKLSSWLGAEKAAGRIYGTYNWHSPVSSNVGPRTKCYWRVDHASSVPCMFHITMPAEACAFLGLKDTEPTNSGQTEEWHPKNAINTNTSSIAQGEAAPFVNLVFKPLGPGRIAQEFSEAISYTVENEKGTIVDQYSALPQVIKASCDSTKPWSLFLLNETVLVVGSYEAGVITNCWLAPFQATADKDKDAAIYIGRRADEPEGGDITLRQIFVLESSLSTLLATMLYGTGTAGYNHSDYDALGAGFGLGIPGELLGGNFENSLTSLPGANAPIAVTIDEPTKFSELFSADLIVRRAFLRWKDEAFEFAQWRTPMAANAVTDLTEGNKAAPAGHVENHRTPTLETAEHARAVIKLDYCRDFAVGRDGQYLKSVQLQDQTAVDDAGGRSSVFTIKLRNAYHDFQNAGAAIEGLIPDFLAFMPALARPNRILTRSVDLRLFEGYGVGDVVTITDSFARDPLTGRRGITERPALITRISYDAGGASPDGTTRPMGGEVDLMFMDLHRGELYSPCAQVDDTATNAGYNAGTKVLTCYEHKYSHSVSFTVNWGRVSRTFYINEDADATGFEVGDAINIIEMDPANPASPLTWGDTVAGQSGNTLTLTGGLGGWDNTKKYRVVPQLYSQVTATQQDYAFQAASDDRMIEDLDPFFHYVGSRAGIGSETFTSNTGSEKAELIPTIAYGDGRPQDPGYDRALIYSLNNFHDYKSAHQSPNMWWRAGLSPSSSASDAPWSVMMAGPIFLGLDTLSTVVTRSLTVAPFFSSSGDATGKTSALRVTLSRLKPQLQVSANPYIDTSGYRGALFTGEFSQTAEWTCASSDTAWRIGDDKTLSIHVKDLVWGYAWLVIEGRYSMRCRGLAKCFEGPRTITAAGNALLSGVNEL